MGTGRARRTPWRWPRVLALAVLLLGGVTFANIRLHGESRGHEVTRSQLSELNMLLHEESSLQWKTLADRNSPVRVGRELGTIRARERAILDTLTGVADLRRQIAEYHDVLDQELGLLGVGKTAEALALERRETDPRFARLNIALQRLEDEAVAAADQANDIADLALMVAMAAAVTAIGFLLFRFEREHRATQRANEELLLQQQLALDTLAENEALVRHQASHDPLTGLPNRRALTELLEAEDGHRALLLVDLDDFKPVNDRLGHAAGDELLIGVAGRLVAAAGAEDTVVRLGGDEFAVVVAGGDAEVATHVAERIVAAVGTPFDIAGAEVCVGASVGVAVGDGTADGAQLLREADRAMYHVKQSGKGGYEVHCGQRLAAA
ncbi:GGDEF domain-containing protein [Dactylosporangium fulvum]|uniref:GGDEF domain-containing protein n=1 Tax=Dactylosporangium fulvum TaxID=53359 RepID=A0ABY5VMQ9_9ACTN|nr:GGDEF domain-containing protein [Dactylosporangium fulvum]UWP78997.1 GGDEF domain-containing protein [Dactylosporangium fulvum]